MSKKTLGSDPRPKGLGTRDLTAKKVAGIKGGIVTDNKDPGGVYRALAAGTGFFRSVGGLSSETE